jgi:3-deoxy-7-phosphoheptulonate synthase
MVEVHPDPENALSDGPQSLTFPQFAGMMGEIERLRAALRSQPVGV